MSSTHSSQVKDTCVDDDTSTVDDDVLMRILVEAATAVEVQPEVEDQICNRQPNNFPFCLTDCSFFILGFDRIESWSSRMVRLLFYPKRNQSSTSH